MSHEIERLLRAAASDHWFIHPAKAEQILAAIALRVSAGPRSEPAFPDAQPVAMSGESRRGERMIRVVRLHGSIMPRGNMMSDMSGAVSLERFQAAFRQAAEDSSTSAIVIDIDSPGGNVSLVPETVALIRSYRSADRPIVAMANTMAASAAYWIAMAADELVVTPSGQVGSIGVYMMHQEMSTRLAEEGVKVTFAKHGPRKTEGNPYEPLDEAALRAMEEDGRQYYDMFVNDVAKGRGVPASVVRADPEAGEKHFGGGRCYSAAVAVKLGMADRVATMEETLARLSKGGRVGKRRASIERRRLALS
ncbi:S49 family peptidase [Roseovarius aestuarii]|nr:S49 family peptidase [Roseovarius aestuarii]